MHTYMCNRGVFRCRKVIHILHSPFMRMFLAIRATSIAVKVDSGTIALVYGNDSITNPLRAFEALQIELYAILLSCIP